MKSKSKKNPKQMLSDRIADALTLKPRADIEDDQVFGTKPQTVKRSDLGSSDSEEEATISDFRKRNVNLLSQISNKYEGQVVSRTELDTSDHLSEDDSDEDSNLTGSRNLANASDDESDNAIQNEISLQTSESEDFESDSGKNNKNTAYKMSKSKSDEESTDDDDDENSDEEGSDEGEGYDISKMGEPLKEDFEHVKKQNISEDVKKGTSVRNQLLLWEGLLEMRIHLQRCVNTANQMPMPEMNKELRGNNQFSEETNKAKTNITTLLDKLLSLQSLLFKNFPETKSLSTKAQDKTNTKTIEKEDSDEEIPSDTDNEEIPSDTEEDEPTEKANSKVNIISTTKKRKFEDYEQEISKCHKSFKAFRDMTIQKWNDKTRLATAANIKAAPTNTILQQISYILSDKEKLIHRTQLKRSEYDIVGYKKDEPVELSEMENQTTKDRKDVDEYIPEIFDDSDFYHQLLRELIECKSSDISDPVQLSRQWIALQQMRSKMKRKVDTKATKGRKIKYVVHNKLVNYMAPIKSNKWTDESTNELYNSLFGKMFEHNNIGLNGDIGNVYKLT